MKRVFFTVLVLAALLAITTGTVFAGSALELVDVRNDDGVPTFIFRVTGEFSNEELENGFVQVDGGEAYPLYCEQIDDDTVVCHTTKKVAGHNVVVGFGGARFWTFAPEARQSQYCYNIYDWNDEEFAATAWFAWGTHCQDQEVELYQHIEFYTDLFGLEDYFFFPGTGGACGWIDPGEGFYYPGCPNSGG